MSATHTSKSFLALAGALTLLFSAPALAQYRGMDDSRECQDREEPLCEFGC